MDYIKYLKEQVKRLEEIQKYDMKSQKAKKDKEKEYYREGMRMLFQSGENFDNYEQVLSEYRQAIITREDVKAKLYNEIDIIKKLKI